MDDMPNHELASRIAERLRWSVEAAFLGLRAGFRCEYCGRPLLRSVEDYDSWQNDHVLPVSRGGSEDYVTNKALSCKTCNFVKRHTLLEEPLEVLTREEIVLRYREVIRERRTTKQQDLDQVCSVLTELGVTLTA